MINIITIALTHHTKKFIAICVADLLALCSKTGTKEAVFTVSSVFSSSELWNSLQCDLWNIICDSVSCWLLVSQLKSAPFVFKAKDADGAAFKVPVCGCNFECNLTQTEMKYELILVVISVVFSQILYKNDPFIKLTQGLHDLFVGLSSQQSFGLSSL